MAFFGIVTAGVQAGTAAYEMYSNTSTENCKEYPEKITKIVALAAVIIAIMAAGTLFALEIDTLVFGSSSINACHLLENIALWSAITAGGCALLKLFFAKTLGRAQQ